jgi:cullin 1
MQRRFSLSSNSAWRIQLSCPYIRWRFLEAGVKQILTHPSEEFDHKTYMGLSTSIHNICTAKKEIRSGFVQGYSGSNRGTGLTFGSSIVALIPDNYCIVYLFAKELYERLKNLLETHLQEIRNKAKEHSNEALLQFCIEERDKYTTAALRTNHLFKYLNRHFVKWEIQEGKKEIYDVYTLHLVLWKEVVVAVIHTSVADAVSQLVAKQHNGEIIDDSLVKSIINSFGKYCSFYMLQHCINHARSR